MDQKYAIWHPKNYSEETRKRTEQAKAHAVKMKEVIREKSAVVARSLVESSSCSYAKSQVRDTQNLSTVVVEAANLRASRDEFAVDAAATRGAVLDLQRAAFALSLVLGIEMNQPLGEPRKGENLLRSTLPTVVESLRASTGVIVEATRALSLLRSGQSAVKARVDYLRAALNTGENMNEELLALARGDREMVNDMVGMVKGIEDIALKENLEIREIEEKVSEKEIKRGD